METTKVQYGLKLKKKDRILGIERTYNGDDRYACGEYTYRLDEWCGDKPWLVDSYDDVVMAKWVSEEWYNSEYESPVNPYNPLDLEIIKVVTITVVKETDLEDEIDLVNEQLKVQGYSTIDKEDYL
jgi:hypothetical protein